MSDIGEYIFVYGLFRDQARGILGEEAKRIKRDSVSGSLWRVNEFYPGIKIGKSGKVWGDVYLFNPEIIANMDEYEGIEYNRVKITTDSGIECWVYEYKFDISDFKEIPSGDWYLR